MKFIKPAGLCFVLLMWSTASAVDSLPPLDPAVQRVIDAFQPLKLLPKGQLSGLYLVLNPVGHGSLEAAARRNDELAFWTAGYLFHLVRIGEAVPALARSDLDTLLQEDETSIRTLFSVAEKAKSHLILCVEFSDGPDAVEGVSAVSGHPLSADLAKCLSDSTGYPVKPHALFSAITQPAALVRARTPSAPAIGVDAVPCHKILAEKIYQGVAAFVAAKREAVLADRTGRWGKDPVSEVDPEGVRPYRSESKKYAALLRTLWPEGSLPLNKAAWFCGLFRRVSLSDNTIVYFDPQATIEEDTLVLRGATTVPILKETLEKVLTAAGVSRIRNEMRLLPEQGGLGEKAFGACAAPTARIYVRPSDMSGPQTQLLYGEPLFLLDSREGYFLVQASDGYWGWVRREAVVPMTREEFTRYTSHEEAVLLKNVEYDGGVILQGSRLPVKARTAGGMTLLTPSGRELALAVGMARYVDDASICRQRPLMALKLLYTPYLFGARSPIGLDCSGLVNNLFEQAGLPVARDATQQLLAGKLVATRWYRQALQPGDRIYFIDMMGKVYHTGIAVSSSQFVHSSPPCVRISDLATGARLYEEVWDKNFLVAKRP